MKIDPWNILLVEDDEDDYILTNAVVDEIKNRPITLKWVSSLEAGLAELATSQPDALLVDYHLGAYNGVDFMRAAVARGCQQPFILLTGEGSYAVDLEAMQSGFADYLVKGELTSVLLERTIRYAIERQRLIIENEEARLRAEQAAQEAQNRADELDAVIVSMVDPVLIYNEQGILVRCNPTAIDAFGFDPVGLHRTVLEEKVRLHKLTGKPVEETDLPSYRVQQAGAIKDERFVFTNPAGEERAILISASPLLSSGSLSGSVVTWRDVTEREALLAQVEAEHDKLQAIIQNAPEGIVVADRNGHILLANPVAEKLFARPIPYGEEYSSHSGLQICNPVGTPYDPRDLPFIRSALEGESFFNIEMAICQPDGRLVPILASSAPIRDRQGNITGSVSIFQDISAIKHFQEELQVREANLAQAAELARLGYWSWDEKTDQIEFSEELFDFLGIPPNSLTNNEELFKYAYPDDIAIITQAGNTCWKTEKPVDIEFRLLRPDGEIRYAHDLIRVAYDAQGHRTGLRGALQDITHIKLAEQALNETQDRLRMATEAADIGMWSRDLETNEITWNEKSIAMYGLPPGTGLHFPQLLELIHPDDRHAVVDANTRAFEKGENLEIEFRVIWPDGSVHWILAKGNVAAGAGGPPRQFTGIDMDITRRKENEAETRRNAARIEVHRHLMHQREMERQKIARDLHDGPIQELIGMTFTIQEIINLAQNTSLIEKIGNLQDTLQAQIRVLREFSGELRPPTLARFGLEKAITTHAETFLAKHPGWNIHLQLAHDEQRLPEVARVALFRIYQELIINVLRHSGTNEVTVRFTLDEKYTVLEVSDNGRGFNMPQDWVELARQGHLGLVGVRERAEAIGGWVDLESSPGKGTCLRVTIPLEGQKTQEPVIGLSELNLGIG